MPITDHHNSFVTTAQDAHPRNPEGWRSALRYSPYFVGLFAGLDLTQNKRLQMSIEMNGEGEHTRLTKETGPRRMPWMFKLMVPLVIKFMTPRQYDKDLKRIKPNLES